MHKIDDIGHKNGNDIDVEYTIYIILNRSDLPKKLIVLDIKLNDIGRKHLDKKDHCNTNLYKRCNQNNKTRKDPDDITVLRPDRLVLDLVKN